MIGAVHRRRLRHRRLFRRVPGRSLHALWPRPRHVQRSQRVRAVPGAAGGAVRAAQPRRQSRHPSCGQRRGAGGAAAGAGPQLLARLLVHVRSLARRSRCCCRSSPPARRLSARGSFCSRGSAWCSSARWWWRRCRSRRVGTLFRERASLTQSYDSGPLGRFGRHIPRRAAGARPSARHRAAPVPPLFRRGSPQRLSQRLPVGRLDSGRPMRCWC